ncbi:hypothetical protein M885DRAFT_133338 [Pelagophyceae sp. CCMP2097]|nr:hypothetical protein M885DRAFT_133338 [Pelagophyceae sp. CCMP2097]
MDSIQVRAEPRRRRRGRRRLGRQVQLFRLPGADRRLRLSRSSKAFLEKRLETTSVLLRRRLRIVGPSRAAKDTKAPREDRTAPAAGGRIERRLLAPCKALIKSFLNVFLKTMSLCIWDCGARAHARATSVPTHVWLLCRRPSGLRSDGRAAPVPTAVRPRCTCSFVGPGDVHHERPIHASPRAEAPQRRRGGGPQPPDERFAASDAGQPGR